MVTYGVACVHPLRSRALIGASNPYALYLLSATAADRNSSSFPLTAACLSAIVFCLPLHFVMDADNLPAA